MRMLARLAVKSYRPFFEVAFPRRSERSAKRARLARDFQPTSFHSARLVRGSLRLGQLEARCAEPRRRVRDERKCGGFSRRRAFDALRAFLAEAGSIVKASSLRLHL